jgi:hypothetical protein
VIKGDDEIDEPEYRYQKPFFSDKVDKPAAELWLEAKDIKVTKNKWSKAKIIKFSRLLHECRSIQYQQHGTTAKEIVGT